MNHEEAVVKAFTIPVRQDRYLEFLQSPKKRAKFIAQLAHFKHLNPKFVVGIPGNQQNPSSRLKLLVEKGAGTKCWVISENSELDGQESLGHRGRGEGLCEELPLQSANLQERGTRLQGT